MGKTLTDTLDPIVDGDGDDAEISTLSDESTAPKKKGPSDRIGELTYKFRESEREKNQLKTTVFELQAAMAKIQKEKAEAEVDRLYQQRKIALEEGNYDELNKIDRRINQEVPTQQIQNQAGPFNAIEYFKSAYPWYDTNTKMQKYAQALDSELSLDPRWKTAHPELRLDEVAKRTEQEFKISGRKISGTDVSSGERFESTGTSLVYGQHEAYIMELGFPTLTKDQRKKKWVEIQKKKGTEE